MYTITHMPVSLIGEDITFLIKSWEYFTVLVNTCTCRPTCCNNDGRKDTTESIALTLYWFLSHMYLSKIFLGSLIYMYIYVSSSTLTTPSNIQSISACVGAVIFTNISKLFQPSRIHMSRAPSRMQHYKLEF